MFTINMKKLFYKPLLFITVLIIFLGVYSFCHAQSQVVVTQETTPAPHVTFDGFGFNDIPVVQIWITKDQTSLSSSIPSITVINGNFTAQSASVEVGSGYNYQVTAPDTGVVLASGSFNFTGSGVSKDYGTDLGNYVFLDNTQSTDTRSCKEDHPEIYCLLAPLGKFDRISTDNFGSYVNTLISVVVGLAAVMAVVMIVLGGIQWMSTDSISGHSEGKDRIQNALFGLILLLGAYAILNTINPDLVNLNISISKATIEVSADEKLFGRTEIPSSVKLGYTIAGSSFSSPAPSAGVADFSNHLKNDGYSINEIDVNTSSRKAKFIAKKTSSADYTVEISINIGANGVAETGQGVEGDGKTPKGTTAITEIRASTSTDKAVLSKNGYNLGAYFINLGATYNGKDRGIGFHGHANNTLGSTNGCVRMRNDDLLVLGPYMKTGTKVVIQ